MKLFHKLLILAVSVCLVLSVSPWTAAAGLTLSGNRNVVPTVGVTELPLVDATTVSVFAFVPGEAGLFRFTLSGTDCTLYIVSGSMYYLYNPQEVAGNAFEHEVKESYISSPMLIGAAGTGTATLTIERVGEASFDVNALPYETYATTENLTKFAKPKTVELVNYVDVTQPHTAVKATDGTYRLDSADGPVLYINLAGGPYISITAAAANGAMKDVYYDENGEFLKKEEYITCINEYYGYTDNATNKQIPGYTDGGIYPLTDDMVYIMQNHTANCGWNDSTSPNYLFVGETVDADTAWMFPVCYFLYTGDVNGDYVIDSADAVYLLYHTMLPDMYPLTLSGDINKDSSVDASDAVYLLYHGLLPELYPIP